VVRAIAPSLTAARVLAHEGASSWPMARRKSIPSGRQLAGLPLGSSLAQRLASTSFPKTQALLRMTAYFNP
jgi:hypothetical protein